MTITNLKTDLGKEDTRTLLEACGTKIEKTVGNSFALICPSCEVPEAYIYFNLGDSKKIICNRKNKCGEEIELWDHIAKKLSISSGQEMLRFINHTLGRPFNNENFKEKNMRNNMKDNIAVDMQPQEKNQEKEQEKQEFFTHCQQIFVSAMNKPENTKIAFTRKYLTKGRGYTEDQIRFFRLGFLPDKEELLETLTKEPYWYQKEQAEELIEEHLGSFMKNNEIAENEEMKLRIVFTWFNVEREILGFWARKARQKEKGDNYHYMCNKGLKKSETLFNIENVRINDPEKDIAVIVEGEFDALSASYYLQKDPQKGEISYYFVAMGGSNTITNGQVEALKKVGVSNCILLLDNDDAGKGDILQSAEKLKDNGIITCIAYIPDGCGAKDVDELIRKDPTVNLISILENAEVAEVRPSDGGENEPLTLKRLEVEANTLQDLKEGFRSTVLGCIRNSEEMALGAISELEGIVAASKKEEYKRELEAKLKKANTPEELVNLAKELNKLFNKKEGVYSEEDFVKDLITESPEGLKMGFKEWDKHITIEPETYLVIAGRPSHGKTTFMLNILRNMLEKDDEINKDKSEKERTYKSFLFYSYEEPNYKIVFKLILEVSKKDSKIAAKEGVSYMEKVRNHMKAHYGTTEMSPNIREAYDKVMGWIKSGRLKILYKRKTVEDLSDDIARRIKESKNPVAAIFIDYVQKLNSEDKAKKGSRQAELQVVSNSLLNIVITYKTPIIVGAQVNREVKSFSDLTLETLRECGDIEQDASTVIKIWDEEAEKKNRKEKKLDELKANNKQNEQNDLKTLEEELKNYEPPAEKNLITELIKHRDGARNIKIILRMYSDRLRIAME